MCSKLSLPVEDFSANGEQCLTGCLSPGGKHKHSLGTTNTVSCYRRSRGSLVCCFKHCRNNMFVAQEASRASTSRIMRASKRLINLCALVRELSYHSGVGSRETWCRLRGMMGPAWALFRHAGSSVRRTAKLSFVRGTSVDGLACGRMDYSSNSSRSSDVAHRGFARAQANQWRGRLDWESSEGTSE